MTRPRTKGPADAENSREDLMTRLSALLRSSLSAVAALDARHAHGARARRRASAGQSHHRGVRLSLARRLHAAGDQGQETRRGARPRHRIRRAPAGRLYDAIQFRRVQGRRQRRGAHRRPGRCPRREGEVSVQPVRLLGHGRHLAARGQDGQGPGRQAARRRQLDHQFRDVRVLRQAAGRRRFQDPGGQHRAAGPGRLCRWPTAPTRSSFGSRPIRC